MKPSGSCFANDYGLKTNAPASFHTDADYGLENLTRADDFLPFWILTLDLQAEATETSVPLSQVQQLVLQVMASGPASLENKHH